MSSRLSNDIIKAEAKNLGFFACGIAKAEPVDAITESEFTEWLDKGCHADMAYMANHKDKRLDPRLLMDGLKSIVCVAMNYTPARRIPENELQFAAYALGQDYHFIMKDKLRTLAERLGLQPYNQNTCITPLSSAQNGHKKGYIGYKETCCNTYKHNGTYRAFCDSAPILERYWAEKAGIGWIGKNHQLIIPHAGSMFFLGELLIDIELDYDTPAKNRCGKCHACMDACPTGALSGTQEEILRTCDNNHGMAIEKNRKNRNTNCKKLFNANLCLSYHTIENRGEIPRNIAASMENTIYGCDRCQQACPWNRFASPAEEPLLQAGENLLRMTREQWSNLTKPEYNSLFKNSAVKRAKYEGLMRNIRAINNKSDNNDNDNRTGK